jgi:hypothetical protein
MRKLPEIGKFYDCYDDGKIHDSRKYLVRITNIIPFSEISSEILKNGKNIKKDMIGCLQKKRITLSLLTVMKEENFVYLNQYLFVLMMANGLVWVNCGIVDF